MELARLCWDRDMGDLEYDFYIAILASDWSIKFILAPDWSILNT